MILHQRQDAIDSFPGNHRFLAEYELGGLTNVRRVTNGGEYQGWQRRTGRDDWRDLPRRIRIQLEAQYQRDEYTDATQRADEIAQ